MDSWVIPRVGGLNMRGRSEDHGPRDAPSPFPLWSTCFSGVTFYEAELGFRPGSACPVGLAQVALRAGRCVAVPEPCQLLAVPFLAQGASRLVV